MKKQNFISRYWCLLKAIPLYITITLVLSVIGMNLLAQFTLLSLPYLALNYGICCSWITFLIMDVVVKHYGVKAANFLSLLAIFINILVSFLFFIIGKISGNASLDIFSVNQWSILTASTIAFILSALSNNFINVYFGKKIKINPYGTASFLLRSSISTFIGQFIDNFIFIFLAFYLLPKLPFATQVHWTLAQCFGCSIFGAFFELGTEIIFAPLGYLLVKYWRSNYVGYSYIKSIIKLDELSAHEIGEYVNKGFFSADEVVSYFENKIKLHNKDINAFTYTKFEEAHEAAKKIDERIKKGEYIGPFAGVPFGLKDFLDSKPGWTNSIGGIPNFDREDKSYSPVTKALEELGAIAIGKCNAPSYGFRGLTDNYRYGPTSTPFNFSYNAGGSSGGSAAAVAYGLIPLAEGGDAGGSLRIPACFTNTFGFKASSGTIPSPLAYNINQEFFPFCMPGAITKSVTDSAILLQKMASYDPNDLYSVTVKNIDYVKESHKNLKGLRVAYTDDFNIFAVDEEVKKYVYKKAKSFKVLGCKVDKIKFPLDVDQKELTDLWLLLISQESHIEINNLKKQGIDITKGLSKEFLSWDEKVAKLTEADKAKYLNMKNKIKEAFDKIYQDYDLIVSPVSGVFGVKNTDDHNTLGPSKINGVEVNPLIGFALTQIVNYIGNPACSIPAGLNKDGLPVGLHIVGRLHEDELILRAANSFEKIHVFQYDYKCARKSHKL